MNARYVRTLLGFLLVSLVVDVCTATADEPRKQLSEAEKIDALIRSVENEKGSVFIRNDEEHTPKAAADHLRSKRRYAGRKITTARQFIDKLATGSSQTGKAYRIRLADGKEMTSAEFLNGKLAKLLASERAPSPH